MECPNCDFHIDFDYVRDEGVEANEVFGCPSCDAPLRYTVDEGTYLGAQHVTVELVDD